MNRFRTVVQLYEGDRLLTQVERGDDDLDVLLNQLSDQAIGLVRRFIQKLLADVSFKAPS